MEMVTIKLSNSRSIKIFSLRRASKKTTRLIKLPVLPLNNLILVLKFLYKVPQMLSVFTLNYQIVSRPFYEHESSQFFACGGHLLTHEKFISWDEKKQTKENFSVTKKFISHDNLHLCVENFRPGSA